MKTLPPTESTTFTLSPGPKPAPVTWMVRPPVTDALMWGPPAACAAGACTASHARQPVTAKPLRNRGKEPRNAFIVFAFRVTLGPLMGGLISV